MGNVFAALLNAPVDLDEKRSAQRILREKKTIQSEMTFNAFTESRCNWLSCSYSRLYGAWVGLKVKGSGNLRCRSVAARHQSLVADIHLGAAGTPLSH